MRHTAVHLPRLPSPLLPCRSERVLALTGEIITDLNSSNYTVWEWRWRCVQVWCGGGGAGRRGCGGTATCGAAHTNVQSLARHAMV